MPPSEKPGTLTAIEAANDATMPALEMWSGYPTADGRLVQASLEATPSGPEFRVNVIDAMSGSATNVFTSPVGHGIGLWPELSTDDRFAVGPAYSLEDGLVRAAGAPITVRLLSVTDGRSVGSETLDGGH